MMTLITRTVARIVALLDRTPYWLAALVARLALANVFWQSGQAKLGNWDGTLFLFADTYKVPLLPPDLAAYMAVSMELSMPLFLVLGLGTRFAALALMGMTLVIQLFVMPEAWPVHIQWLAMMLALIARGGGVASADHLVAGLWGKRCAAYDPAVSSSL